MEAVLARYGSRITVTELNEALLHAVDEALAARTDGELQQQLDRLRVIAARCSKASGGRQRMRANSSRVLWPPRAASQGEMEALPGTHTVTGGSRRARKAEVEGARPNSAAPKLEAQAAGATMGRVH